MVTPVLVTTDYAKNWVAITREAYLIYQGESVNTYLNQRQQVLSLVTPQIGASPLNVVIPASNLNLASPKNLDFSAAQLWNPRPDWDRLSPSVECLPAIIRETYSTGSWGYWLLAKKPRLSTYQTLVYTSADKAIFSLLSAIAENRISQINVSQIVGSGEGLTPAGDDWLLGCILALHLCGYGEIAQFIANLACSHTTPLSAAYLQAAGDGTCSLQWHSFLENPTPETAYEIASQGHTSGNSALSGFYMTLKAIKKA